MFKELVHPYVLNEPVYKVAAPLDAVMKEYGLTVMHKMNSNENQLGISPKAVEAMKKAAEDANFYPEGSGKKLREKYGAKIGVDADQILVTEGASVGLNLLGEVLIRPGDEIVCPAVTYGSYKNITLRNEAKYVEVPMKDDLGIDFDGILAAVTPKTKMIIICNPNNPTGIACDTEELKAFINKVPSHVITIVDEAYIQFTADPAKQTVVGEIAEGKNLIVVQTFSKLYGMAGARVGFLISNKEIIKYLNRLANYFCTNRMALEGAIAAIDDDEFATMTYTKIKEGRDYFTKEFTEMGGKVYPSSTNFIYCDLGFDPFTLAEELKKFGYAIRGSFALTRISIGTMEQNTGLVAAIKKVLGK